MSGRRSVDGVEGWRFETNGVEDLNECVVEPDVSGGCAHGQNRILHDGVGRPLTGRQIGALVPRSPPPYGNSQRPALEQGAGPVGNVATLANEASGLELKDQLWLQPRIVVDECLIHNG